MNPSAGGNVLDVIAARKLAEDIEEIESDETTTILPDDHEIMRRSLNEDAMVVTRRGSYRLIENRLNK